MSLFKRKPPYTQDDISQVIGDISTLMKQRDQAYQLALTQNYPEAWQEVNRGDTNIEIAQRVLGHMLEQMDDHFNRQRKTSHTEQVNGV